MNYKVYDQVIWAPLIWSLHVLWTEVKLLFCPFCTAAGALPFLYCSGLRFWAIWNRESDQSIHQSCEMSIWNLNVYGEMAWRTLFSFLNALSSDHDSFFRFRKWCCVVWLSSHFFPYVCYKLFLPKRSKREKNLCYKFIFQQLENLSCFKSFQWRNPWSYFFVNISKNILLSWSQKGKIWAQTVNSECANLILITNHF